MNIINLKIKYLLVLLLSIILWQSIGATQLRQEGRDTIIPDRSYAGYRLHLNTIRIERQKPRTFYMTLTVVNTGKFDIHLGEGNPMPYLQITYDHSLLMNNLQDYTEQIRKSILSEAISLKTGEIKSGLQLKVRRKVNTSALQAATAGKKKPAKNTDNTHQNDRTPVEYSIDEQSSGTEEMQQTAEVVFTKPEFESKSLDEILEEKNNCPDLVFNSLHILENDGKEIRIRYEISNVGIGPAQLFGLGAEKNENLAIRAFISGSKKISKGSIVIGGDFLPSPENGAAQQLQPGQTYSGEIKLDIRRKTRYMPVLILSLDAFLLLRECDRTNNTKAILLD